MSRKLSRGWACFTARRTDLLLRGECLRHVTTLNFSASGEPGEWRVTVAAPGNIILERTAYDSSPYGLLDELFTEAFRECYARYPERRPPPPRPKPHRWRCRNAKRLANERPDDAP